MNETKSPYMQPSRHRDGRMTREEAKDILKAIQALICPNKGSVLENNFSEAFDMAIEALSEPINCVKCKHYGEDDEE